MVRLSVFNALFSSERASVTSVNKHVICHLGFCCSPKMTSENVVGCPWPPAHQIW